MQAAIRLVRGAVSTKDLIPVLTHFHIYNGRIQGANGRVAIDTALPGVKSAALDITVPAERFLRAVDACDGAPTLTLISDSKLRVKRGGFTALLPLADHASYPREEKTGEAVQLTSTILPILRCLRAFISDDASRPWSMGIFFKNGYAYATNNAVMVRAPAPWAALQGVNLPVYAVDELLRINCEPTALYQSANSLVFEWSDAWLKAQVLTGAWPDVAARFDGLDTGAPIDAALLAAITTVLPFCLNPKFPVIIFSATGISTEDGDCAAAVDVAGLPAGRFRAEVLQAVLQIAETANFAAYPAPIGFSGDGVVGMFVGMRG